MYPWWKVSYFHWQITNKLQQIYVAYWILMMMMMVMTKFHSFLFAFLSILLIFHWVPVAVTHFLLTKLFSSHWSHIDVYLEKSLLFEKIFDIRKKTFIIMWTLNSKWWWTKFGEVCLWCQQTFLQFNQTKAISQRLLTYNCRQNNMLKKTVYCNICIIFVCE